MSIFNKKLEEKQEAQVVGSHNTIGKGTTITGDIEAYGNLRIEGKIIGNIRSKSKVVLGPGSYVEGNVTAQNAEVEGEVKGNIEISEILYVRSTASLIGDIIASKMVSEAGHKINSNRMSIGENSKPMTAIKSGLPNKNGKALEKAI